MELLITALILAILAATAIPKVFAAIDKAKVARAISDVSAISSALRQYNLDKGTIPSSDLNNLVPDYMDKIPTDPWDQEYKYYNHSTGGGNGVKRMAGPIVPINTLYDLYSEGKNKQTTPNINGNPSRDDVILANDGGFVGLAIDY